MGAKKHQQILYIHQWFLLTFVCKETRHKIKELSDNERTFPVPQVLDTEEFGFKFDGFIQHILENDFDEDEKVKSGRRRCCYQWKGVLKEPSSDNESEASNDMESSFASEDDSE